MPTNPTIRVRFPRTSNVVGKERKVTNRGIVAVAYNTTDQWFESSRQIYGSNPVIGYFYLPSTVLKRRK